MRTLWLAVGMAGLLSGADQTEVRVLVTDRTGLSAERLDKAMQQATQVFERASIRLEWTLLRPDATLETPPGRVYYVEIHRTDPRKGFRDYALGFSLLWDGNGNQAGVVMDRVEETARRRSIEMETVLGCVIAHELGHLILKSPQHTLDGLMATSWRPDDALAMRRGLLSFSGREAKGLHKRLKGE